MLEATKDFCYTQCVTMLNEGKKASAEEIQEEGEFMSMTSDVTFVPTIRGSKNGTLFYALTYYKDKCHRVYSGKK